jgi:uncharacterized Zn finger protein
MHLELSPGRIHALVAGSDVYEVDIDIKPLDPARWDGIKHLCRGRISNMCDLLSGQLSSEVMEVVCDRSNGLFPRRDEINYRCSCPDWAVLCKHVAAVFYGIANRLDTSPELIFELRQVDPLELLTIKAEEIGRLVNEKDADEIEESLLGEIFGIVIHSDQELTQPKAFSLPVARSAQEAPDKAQASAAPAALPPRDASPGTPTVQASEEIRTSPSSPLASPRTVGSDRRPALGPTRSPLPPIGESGRAVFPEGTPDAAELELRHGTARDLLNGRPLTDRNQPQVSDPVPAPNADQRIFADGMTQAELAAYTPPRRRIGSGPVKNKRDAFARGFKAPIVTYVKKPGAGIATEANPGASGARVPKGGDTERAAPAKYVCRTGPGALRKSADALKAIVVTLPLEASGQNVAGAAPPAVRSAAPRSVAETAVAPGTDTAIGGNGRNRYPSGAGQVSPAAKAASARRASSKPVAAVAENPARASQARGTADALPPRLGSAATPRAKGKGRTGNGSGGQKGKIVWTYPKPVNFERLTGRDVRRIRLLSGLSQQDLSRILGVGLDTFLRWESETGVLQLRNSSVHALRSYYLGNFAA